MLTPLAVDLVGWAALITAVGTLQLGQFVAQLVTGHRRRRERTRKEQLEENLHETVGQIKEQVTNTHSTNLRDDLDRNTALVGDVARSVEELVHGWRELREDLRIVRRDQTAERERLSQLDAANRDEHAAIRDDVHELESRSTREHRLIRAEIVETARRHHPDAA